MRISSRFGSPQVSFVIWPKPRARAVAMSKSTILKSRGLSHVSLRFAAIASNPDFREVAAGAAFVDPKLAMLCSTITWPRGRSCTNRCRRCVRSDRLAQSEWARRLGCLLWRSMNFPRVSALRWTSIRERLLLSEASDGKSCVMNHSGNWKQAIPVDGAVGSSGFTGGAMSRSVGMSRILASFSASRGSTISSRPGLQKSSPATRTE